VHSPARRSGIELEDGEPLRDIATPESVPLSNEIAQTLNDAIEELLDTGQARRW
jgi:hypothetical protein